MSAAATGNGGGAERRRSAAPARRPALRVRRHDAQPRLRRARGARRHAGRGAARRQVVQPQGPGAHARADGRAGDGRRLVFAGCSLDFANRRFHRLLRAACASRSPTSARAAPGCTATTSPAVTDKAARIVDCAMRYPDAPADTMVCARTADTVLVIGGGVAGTQAAAELAQMGHPVELVEQRPFLGGRAARIGTVFPTNDCGQCLPTTDAQAGTRKCFHRNVAIDNPNLHIWRRTTVESVSGDPGDFEVAPCAACPTSSPTTASTAAPARRSARSPTPRATPRRSTPSSTTAA